MNPAGVKISSKLAKGFVGFLVIVAAGVLMWPRLWKSQPATPEIPVTRFADPPRPIQPPQIAKLLPLPIAQAAPSATPKAQPTPCQPCIEAANEVLARYLAAIRTGAGSDDRDEHRSVYEIPQANPSPSHPVFIPAIPGAN